MPFAIIDQGRRVNTPLRTIFPERGVDKASSSDVMHDSTHNNKDLQTRNNDFQDILENQTPIIEDQTPGTYDGLNPGVKATPKKQGMIAEQIMSYPVHSISEGTTLHKAWERMIDLDISHLIVTDHQGSNVGILSKTDIIKVGKESTESITPYYSKKMIAGLPTTEAARIAACFLEFDINSLPIFDKDEALVGIVCRSDLLRLIISGAHIENWA